ncbi:hypothetical protein ACH5RR_003293 [Cinchona calisaya]|uniref:Uncharacterized protein n=1 Tax=Cinchona calisaya TaxID=153742 RepID=A0ABD3AUD6_9GENT
MNYFHVPEQHVVGNSGKCSYFIVDASGQRVKVSWMNEAVTIQIQGIRRTYFCHGTVVSVRSLNEELRMKPSSVSHAIGWVIIYLSLCNTTILFHSQTGHKIG